ncbi:MAG TPA: tetratricopeptide repeat protein [Chthoniobacterales bacterium]
MALPLEQIRRLSEEGRHEEAREEFVQLAALSPDDAIVLYETACAHDRLGLEAEAIPYYVAAIEAGLDSCYLRGAYLGLGSSYRAMGLYEESLATLDDGLRHFPNAHELRVFQAMALYNLSRFHDAVASLLNVIADTSNDPETRAYERAIRFYAKNLDWRAADTTTRADKTNMQSLKSPPE